jgi:hypothetical protein
MKNIFLTSIITLFIFQACSNKENSEQASVIEFNQELATELTEMSEIDQIAAGIPQGKNKELSREEWQAFKDSVFKSNKNRAEELFNNYGFLGFDLVGKEGSRDFWLIVQHSDFDTDFQKKILSSMKGQMEAENANKKHYAYLIDRVNKNLGEKIIYGTQVMYNKYGQAISQPLVDSANVNARRAAVGLEPLEIYLNRMTTSHFEMNKENMLSRGITEPKLHPVKNN